MMPPLQKVAYEARSSGLGVEITAQTPSPTASILAHTSRANGGGLRPREPAPAGREPGRGAEKAHEEHCVVSSVRSSGRHQATRGTRDPARRSSPAAPLGAPTNPPAVRAVLRRRLLGRDYSAPQRRHGIDTRRAARGKVAGGHTGHEGDEPAAHPRYHVEDAHPNSMDSLGVRPAASSAPMRCRITYAAGGRQYVAVTPAAR